jgi:alpha-tubulin suppressor-like RCC1 family protein
MGNNHILALTKSGKVFAWGDNSHGQIGIPHGQNHSLAPSGSSNFIKHFTPSSSQFTPVQVFPLQK